MLSRHCLSHPAQQTRARDLKTIYRGYKIGIVIVVYRCVGARSRNNYGHWKLGGGGGGGRIRGVGEGI